MNDKQQLAAMGEHMREVDECKSEFKVPDGWKLIPADVVMPELSWPLEIGVVAFEKANGSGCDLIECIYDAVHAMLAAAPEYKP